MTGPMDIRQIVALLSRDAEGLCRKLLPRGRREGDEWVEARRAQGGLGDSLRVHLRSPRAGVWAHFAAGARGDALDLVAYLLFRGDKRAAISWSRGYLGLDRSDPSAFKTALPQIPPRREGAQGVEAARAKKAAAAKAIFLGAQEKLAGTLADRYLRGRGIDLSLLGRQPGALRFHPALDYWRPEASGRYVSIGKFPALVAGIRGPNGESVVAVHRTWLQALPDGRVVKADDPARPRVPEAKLSFGRYLGGCIPIWRGESGKSLAHSPAGETVVVTEGIEDALTVALARPALRVLCAIAIANMAAVVLPQAIARLIVVADNDDSTIVDPETGEIRPHPAVAALRRVVAAHQAQGREVLIARAPQGRKDVNELLTKGAA